MTPRSHDLLLAITQHLRRQGLRVYQLHVPNDDALADPDPEAEHWPQAVVAVHLPWWRRRRRRAALERELCALLGGIRVEVIAV